MQGGISNQFGGIIYADIGLSSSKLDITCCSFIGCKATNWGGALYLSINNTGESTLKNISFNNCEAFNNGGAIYTTLESGGKLTISGSCNFTDCVSLSNNSDGGGGIYVLINGVNSSLKFEDSITFVRCSAYDGGGMFIDISNLGKHIMTGQSIFIDCNSTEYGGGCYINTSSANYNIQLLGNMQFEGCESEIGGGL
ncbi:MAG: hypothetical protein EZS28_052336, partial [Streblomastix strix]